MVWDIAIQCAAVRSVVSTSSAKALSKLDKNSNIEAHEPQRMNYNVGLNPAPCAVGSLPLLPTLDHQSVHLEGAPRGWRLDIALLSHNLSDGLHSLFQVGVCGGGVGMCGVYKDVCECL